MKLTCLRSALSAAFNSVAGVVPTRTPLEILKNVKLLVENGGAHLIGTDNEIGMRCMIADVQTSSHGAVLLPTSRILTILRELQDESVDLDIRNDDVTIKTAQSNFRLSIADAADFPPVSLFDANDYFVVTAGVFRQMIRRTIFAVDTESARFALGGILMELDPAKLTMVATDGRRLSLVHCSCTTVGQPGAGNGQVIVPAKAISLVDRSLDDSAGEVHIAVRQNDIVFRFGNVVLSSQLVQGKFPDYRRVVPKEFATVIDLPSGPFFSAVRQSQIVTDENSRGVRFEFAAGQLSLSSTAASVGESRITVPISFEGTPVAIKFDPKYISDFLKTVDGGASVQFKLNDGNSAGLLSTDEAYQYVMMPLALDE